MIWYGVKKLHLFKIQSLFIPPFSFIIWETKLTPFSEKCLKKLGRLSTSIFRLNHKIWVILQTKLQKQSGNRCSKIEICFCKIQETGLIRNLRRSLLGIQMQGCKLCYLNGEESVSNQKNYRCITVLSKSIRVLQFSYLHQRFLDHLLQRITQSPILNFRS